MTIEIPSEYESVLRHLVASGVFPSTKSALEHALRLLADEQRVTERINGEPSIRSMPKRVDIEELATDQNAAPFDASRAAPEDVWPENEQVDDFIAFINESRQDVPKSGG